MIPTPHIEAKHKSDIAKTVIMPGDPLRSKFIAETFLKNAKLINNVRGIQGYTGTYKGKKVTVMASGMGNPSMGIYSYELFAFYGVENIIRVGSAGAFSESLKLKDLVVANQIFTNTNYDQFMQTHGERMVQGSESLAALAKTTANKLGLSVVTGTTLCSDTFYASNGEYEKQLAKEHNLLAVEMEGAALYLNAQRLEKNALVLVSISDHLVTNEHLSSLDRQTAFTNMITLALEMAK